MPEGLAGQIVRGKGGTDDGRASLTEGQVGQIGGGSGGQIIKLSARRRIPQPVCVHYTNTCLVYEEFPGF